MEKNYWQIDDDVYKVNISADVFDDLEKRYYQNSTRKLSKRKSRIYLLYWIVMRLMTLFE